MQPLILPVSRAPREVEPFRSDGGNDGNDGSVFPSILNGAPSPHVPTVRNLVVAIVDPTIHTRSLAD